MEGEFRKQITTALKAHFTRGLLAGIAGGRTLVLGALVALLAVTVGLALTDPAKEVRAQDAAKVHETAITVKVDPTSKYFHGHSNYPYVVDERDGTESIYGSISNANFEYDGTQYEIQGLFYNWALDVLYFRTHPPLPEASNIRPTLTFGDQTYHGQDTFLSLGYYIWWEDIAPLDWEVGDSVPFSLSTTTVTPSDTKTQQSAGDDLQRALDTLAGFDEAPDQEGGGGSGWVGWAAGAGAVVVASVGYAAYRVLR